MKILAIGDPHGKLPRELGKIVRDSDPDVIVCVGDITPVPKDYREKSLGKPFSPSFERKADKVTEDIIDKLCSFGLPVLMLQGNMYLSSPKMRLMRKLFRKHENLFHKKTGKFRIKKRNFILIDIFWEEHSVRSKRALKKTDTNASRKRRLNEMLGGLSDAIVISHSPPFGVLDMIHSGQHVGSKILTSAIKKHQPKLVLCSHIHEARGEKKIGKTRVINLGCLGDYRVVDV